MLRRIRSSENRFSKGLTVMSSPVTEDLPREGTRRPAVLHRDRAVGTDHHEWVPQGRLNFLWVHVVEKAHGPVSLFDDCVEVRGPWINAALLRKPRDCLAFLRRILRATQEPDPVEFFVNQQPDVSGTRTLVRLDFRSQCVPFRVVPQHSEEFLCRELLGPLRKRVTQGRPEVRVHVVVREDLHASRPGGLPERLDFLRLPDATVLRIVVTNLDRTAGLLADLDAFPNGVDNRLPLTSNVRRVEAAMPSDNLRERDDLFHRGEASGRIH